MIRAANVSYTTSIHMHYEMALDALEGGLLISGTEEECDSSYL